jgi:hypothetical protein
MEITQEYNVDCASQRMVIVWRSRHLFETRSMAVFIFIVRDCTILATISDNKTSI